MKQSKSDKKQYILELHTRLKQSYGSHQKHPSEPTGAIVLGILSANTNDNNRDRAFAQLIKQYPNEKTRWQDVANSKQDELAQIIRPAGMSMIRAERVINTLNGLKTQFGEYSAQAFLDMEPQKAFEELQKFKGIGGKTAAVFLVFNSDKEIPFFPVDTHIHRLAHRMGIFPKKYNVEKIQKLFTELVPSSIVLDFHVNLILLGRNICKARKVYCDKCPVENICPQNLT